MLINVSRGALYLTTHACSLVRPILRSLAVLVFHLSHYEQWTNR